MELQAAVKSWVKVVLPCLWLITAGSLPAAAACPRLDFSDPAAKPLRDTARIIVDGFAATSQTQPTELDGDLLLLAPHTAWAPVFSTWLESVCFHRLTRGDVANLRNLWQTSFNATRSVRGDDGLITDDLATFTAATDFHSWPREIVEFSSIKRQTRAIYRSPEGFGRRLSVSETLETTDGNPSAPVRETEIVLERLDGSGNWDFYAYRQGRLAADSEFPGGLRPSPTTCLSCHFSILTGRSRRNPNEPDDTAR